MQLSDEELNLAISQLTEKEARLLGMEAAEMIELIEQKKFQQALKLYDVLLEGVSFLGGLLIRVANTAKRIN